MVNSQVKLEAMEALCDNDASLRDVIETHGGSLLGQAPDIDATPQLLLLQSIRIGNPRWVRKAIIFGSDPSKKGKDGCNAIQYAEEMSRKHPGHLNRERILQSLRSARDRINPSDRKSVECKSAPAGSSGSDPCSEDFVKNILTTELATVNDAISTIRSGVTSLSSALSTNVVALKQSINDSNNQQAKSASTINTVMQSIMTMRNEQDNQNLLLKRVEASMNAMEKSTVDLETLKKKMEKSEALQSTEVASITESMKAEILEVKSALNTVLTEVRQSLTDITSKQQNVFSIASNLKSSQDEFKRELDETKALMSTEVASMKESIEKQNKDIADVKAICKESEFLKQKVAKEAENKMIPPITTPPGAAELKERCMDAMMRKTEVKPMNEENISKMREWYKMLYDRDSVTASILKFLQFQSSVKVLVDFGSDYIVGMKPTLRDHDGRVRSGSGFYSFADFGEKKAYVNGYWGERRAISFLANALSQLSVYFAFKNKGLPYSGDGNRFKGILEEAQRKKRVELDGWITYALYNKETRHGKEIYLASAVPIMIAYYGSSDGRSELRKQLPSLLEYYDGHVVATLDSATKMMENSRGSEQIA